MQYISHFLYLSICWWVTWFCNLIIANSAVDLTRIGVDPKVGKLGYTVVLILFWFLKILHTHFHNVWSSLYFYQQCIPPKVLDRIYCCFLNARHSEWVKTLNIVIKFWIHKLWAHANVLAFASVLWVWTLGSL